MLLLRFFVSGLLLLLLLLPLQLSLVLLFRKMFPWLSFTSGTNTTDELVMDSLLLEEDDDDARTCFWLG